MSDLIKAANQLLTIGVSLHKGTMYQVFRENTEMLGAIRDIVNDNARQAGSLQGTKAQKALFVLSQYIPFAIQLASIHSVSAIENKPLNKRNMAEHITMLEALCIAKLTGHTSEDYDQTFNKIDGSILSAHIKTLKFMYSPKEGSVVDQERAKIYKIFKPVLDQIVKYSDLVSSEIHYTTKTGQSIYNSAHKKVNDNFVEINGKLYVKDSEAALEAEKNQDMFEAKTIWRKAKTKFGLN